LPAANAVNAGTCLYIGDDGGAITAAFTLTIARAGTDTIHKGTASIILVSPFASIILESDGVSNWTTVSRSPAVNVVAIFSGTTYTPSVGVKALYVECLAAGGGSGGAVASTGSVAAAGGGAGGGYSATFVRNPKTSYTIAVGAGGIAGTAAGGNGGNGGNTTFDSPSICTANGGGGGVGIAAGITGGWDGAGGTGGAAGIGDITVPGSDAFAGFVLNTTTGKAGDGGSSALGLGGLCFGRNTNLNAAGAGVAGHGTGGGASGALSNSSTGFAGGVGANGVIRVTEFF
jgi:hypothetical protein